MISLRLNKDIKTPKGLKKEGSTIDLFCDSNGIPLDKFWRDRLRDSAVDNCVELIKEIINKKRKVNNGKRIS